MQYRRDLLERRALGALALCNACGSCRGYCPVFDQSHLRSMLEKADLLQLAFMCHDCGACLDACQFAPPHTFAIDIQRDLGNLRSSAYRFLAVPRWAEGLFHCIWSVRRTIAGTFLAAAGIAIFQSAAAPHPLGFAALISSAGLSVAAGSLFLWSVIWTAYRSYAFWQQIGRGRRLPIDCIPTAILRGVTWHYFGKQSDGCSSEPTQPNLRSWFHRGLLLGLALCFLATVAGALYRHAFDLRPPYPHLSAPVILGVVGGVFLCVGAIGLIHLRRARVSSDRDGSYLTAELLAIGATGVALLLLRSTTIGMVLLYWHLLLVADLFLRMPFSHLLHGPFRVMSIALMLSDDTTRLNAAGIHHTRNPQ